MGNVKQRAIWGLKDSCWTPLPVVPVETDDWETKPTTVKTTKTIPEEEKQQVPVSVNPAPVSLAVRLKGGGLLLSRLVSVDICPSSPPLSLSGCMHTKRFALMYTLMYTLMYILMYTLEKEWVLKGKSV